MSRLAFALVAALVAAPALLAQNLFPLAEFKFDPATAKLKGAVGADGKYSAGLFVGAKPEGFLFMFQESKPAAAAGHPAFKLDSGERYRDGRCSLKCDFTQMNAAALNRGCFMLRPPVKMLPGKVYEAVIHLKTSTPGMKINGALLGANAGHSGKELRPELLWRPFTVKLAPPEKPKGEPFVELLALDVVSPGVFWVGKVEVLERDAGTR